MRKVLFLSGTRADFGKIKSLIQKLESDPGFEVYVFVTGMHLQWEYGYTLLEIQQCNFENVYTYGNHTHETTMDLTLAKTIEGLSGYVQKMKPDLIVVHGDRVETLAGAIVGSLNNILVAHIEGGEVSGTIDELLRHSVSKLSHIHFVANESAGRRLQQMGETKESIFIIGSPDVDLMLSDNLPEIEKVKEYYDISFDEYAIAMYHPVTTETDRMEYNARSFTAALKKDSNNYVVIYPNNDRGSSAILKEYETLKKNTRFRIIPSLRFEYFLSLFKHAAFIIGNSSAGIREAPYYRKPVINVGTRQKNRAHHPDVIHADYDEESISSALKKVVNQEITAIEPNYGSGNSDELFVQCLKGSELWKVDHQKQFRDL